MSEVVKNDHFENLFNKVKSHLLTGDEVKRNYDENFLRVFLYENKDVPPQYLIKHLQISQLVGADPRKNQVHFTSYFSKKLGHRVGATVFSYHFMLDAANRTGELRGVEVSTAVEKVLNPVKMIEEDQLVSTAKISRHLREPTVFKARWNEFYKDTDFWNNKPYVQLEKTAIANALRWTFPEILSGVYIDAEIEQEEKSKTVLQKLNELPEA